jgi:hypothetical protein
VEDQIVRRSRFVAWLPIAVLTGVLVGAVIGTRLVGSDGGSRTFPVLVAKQLIPAGTRYESIFQRDLVATEYRDDPPAEDRFMATDPPYLSGRVTTRTVPPGEPLRLSDFLWP